MRNLFQNTSNPKLGRSTRMHCINQNLDNIYWNIMFYFFSKFQ